MPNVLQAATGQTQETTSVSGPTSYESGDGFSITTNLMRVDEAMVDIDAGNGSLNWDAVVDSIADDNTIVAKVYSEDTGGEAPQDQDLSSNTITYSAGRL